jgi:glycine/D-amino acid oxidase-like deaminating enzyme
MHANDKNDQRYDYDVIIIGAGPSGLTTATALARSGVRVLVIEKHQGLSIFPKATGIRPRSMEILRGWGLEAEVGRRSQPNQVGMAISRTLAGPRQVVDLGLPSDEVVSAATPPGSPSVAKINSSRCCMIICAPRVGRSGSAPKWSGSARPMTPSASGCVPATDRRATRSRLSIWSAPTADAVRYGRGSASTSNRWARKAITLPCCSMPICRPCFRTRPTS